MGSVTLFNAERMQEIEDTTIVSGFVDLNGHLILQKRNNEVVDAGDVRAPNLADASLTVPGIVQLADETLTIDGTNETRATTPKGVKALLDFRTATETRSGLIPLSTLEELRAGVVDNKAITPLLFSQYLAGQNLSSTDDLNNFTAPGTYGQGSQGNAQVSLNYPLNNAAGVLIVEVWSNYVIQRYHTRVTNASPNRVFERMKSSTNPWGLWVELTDVWGVPAKRPAFQARGTSVVSRSGSALMQILVYDQELFDQNSNYNPTTGRFTAPIEGLYLFSFTAVQTAPSVGPELSVYKNATVLYSNVAIGYAQQSYHTFGATVLAQLTAGDIIDVRWQNNNGQTVSIDRTRSYFTGFMIG